MVAIFTGAGAGTERGSATILGSSGLLGSGATGRSGEQVLVNAANGNLVISQRDEFVVGRGPDVSIGRTYNSLGGYDGDNNDRWIQTTTRRILSHGGSYNAVGSTVQRQSGDGSTITYTHNGSTYVATDGAGAHDTLSYNGSTGAWTWDDGASSITETYEANPYAAAEWRIIQQSDNQDGFINFTYTADRLYRATTSDGSYTQYDWITSGGTSMIAQIVTGFTDLQTSATMTLTRTRYAYDGYNRLSRVTVDLSPNDNSVGDGNSYHTDYTYHGSSTLVATITQKDGSSLAVTYDGNGRVTNLTQAVAGSATRTTTLTYQSGYTTVTDTAGRQTRLDYNTAGALTKITAPPPYAGGTSQTVLFAYSGNGDLVGVTDAAGAVTSYTYDSRGNMLTDTDRLGNTVTRTYEAVRNLMVTETRVGSDKDGAAQQHTTRYIYDAVERLNYSISPEGAVKKYGFYATAHIIEEDQSTRFDLSGYTGTSVPSLATLDVWWTNQVYGDVVIGRVSDGLDSRGNANAHVAYSRFGTDWGNDFTGERVDLVYDQAGQLLSRTPVGRPAAAETFVYDGLGRVVASTTANGGSTTVMFDDAQTKTTVTLSSGLIQTSTYTKSGELVSSTESATSGHFTGGTTTYRYDAAGRLRQVTDQAGGVTYLVYDDAGRKTAEVSLFGSTVEYRYDANDRVIAVGRYTRAAQAAALAQLPDPNSTVTIDQLRPAEPVPPNAPDVWEWLAYDAEGRVTRTIQGDGSVATRQYDASGQLISTLSYENKITAGQLVALRAGSATAAATTLPSAHIDDAVTRVFYDRDGRTIGALDAEGYLTRTIYDAGGRKTQEVAYATRTNTAYRASGTLQQLIDTTPIDSRDRSTRYVFNGRNQLRYVIDALGHVTRYDYDSTNTSIANHHLDQATRITRFAGTIGTLANYNEVTLRTAVAALGSDPANRTSLAVYNERGQLAYSLDDTGAVVGFAYDTNGNLIRETRYAIVASFATAPAIGTMNGWVFLLASEYSSFGASQQIHRAMDRNKRPLRTKAAASYSSRRCRLNCSLGDADHGGGFELHLMWIRGDWEEAAEHNLDAVAVAAGLFFPWRIGTIRPALPEMQGRVSRVNMTSLKHSLDGISFLLHRGSRTKPAGLRLMKGGRHMLQRSY